MASDGFNALSGGARVVFLGVLLACGPGCDSGVGGSTGTADDGMSPEPATGDASDQSPPSDPSTPSAPASTAADWASTVAGQHIHVFLDATDGSAGGGGDVFISGGETYDLYLCTDRTFSGTYEDTTCVSVSVPGMDASDCDGSSTQESYSGTWDVVIDQNIPYLALEVQGLAEPVYFSLGSDGTTFFVDRVPATLAANPYCP